MPFEELRQFQVNVERHNGAVASNLLYDWPTRMLRDIMVGLHGIFWETDAVRPKATTKHD